MGLTNRYVNNIDEIKPTMSVNTINVSSPNFSVIKKTQQNELKM